MSRLIFVNRYYRPDHSATSQILTDLAEYLAASGYQVSVLCSGQLYDNPAASLSSCEEICGVKIHRVRSSRFGRLSLAGRALDYVSFYASSLIWLLRNIHAGDVLIAKTDPPLISCVAAFAAKKRKAMLINWLQDLFPEVAVELRVNIPPPLGRCALACRNHSLRFANVNIAIGDLMADRLRREPGIGPVKAIQNWAPGEFITSVAHADNPLRKEWKLEGKFVVGYSGNFGRAHEFDTLLKAAIKLKRSPGIMFLLIGGGAKRAELEALARKEGLENILFKPYQPRELLSQSLSAADVHLVSQLPELEGLIVPSKFYGIIAASRPAIFIGSSTGEIATLVKQYDCGFAVEPGNAEGLASAIENLASNPVLTSNLGINAKKAASGPLSRTTALAAWSVIARSAIEAPTSR